jgi:uncharacterized protein YkwD
MQTNPKKYLWLWVGGIIVIIAVMAILGFHYQKNLKNIFTKSDSQETLLDKLIGPIRETRAKQLSPEQIIYWTNYYRKENGLKELTQNSLLGKAAQDKVNDMFSKQYFEHVSPTGVTPAQVVTGAGYSYKETGENLALGDFLTEKDLVDAWMNSPGHRANILNPDYTEIGVATGLRKFQDRPETWLAVQEFGKPMPNCVKPAQSKLDEINAKKSELDKLNAQIKALSGSTDQATAEALSAQAKNLYNEIETESNQYNSNVDTYNACIAQ